MATSAVVEKRFIWKFVDQVTQGIKKARSAMQEAENAARKAGIGVQESSNSWTKYGDTAKKSVTQLTEQLQKNKEAFENYRNRAVDATKDVTRQLDLYQDKLKGIPSYRTTNFKVKVDDPKLASWARKVHDVPKEKSTWLKIKDGFSNRLKNARNQAEQTKRSFSILKSVMAGTFVGGAILNGVYAIGNGIKAATAAGMEFDTEQQKMLATWKTLTGSKQQAQGMVDTINDLSIKTGQATDTINELEQGFYHLHSSKSEADDMTKAMLNMGDAVGLSGQQLTQVEQDMVHGLATGKVTQGELNQIGMYFPMIDEKMAKHFHTTVAGMRKMASAGKITGKDLEEVFEKMGNSGKYKKAVDNMMETTWGSMRTIKSMAPRLVGAMEQGLFNARNPLVGAVAKWTTDPATKKGFENAGRNIANTLTSAISTVTNLVKSFQPLNKIIGSIVGGLASGIWIGFSATVKAIATGITTVVNWFSRLVGLIPGIGKGNKALDATNKYFKILGVILGGVLGILATYKSAVGVVIALTKTWGAVTKAFTAVQTALDVALDTNPIGLIVIAIAAVIGALVLAYKHIKPFRDAVNNGFKLLVSAGKKVINFFKNDWKEIALFLVNPIAGGFALAYKHSSKFRSFCHKISKDFESLGKDIKKKSKSIAKTIGDTFTGKASWERDLKKNFSKMMKEYQKNAKQRANLEKKQQEQERKQWQKHWKTLQKGSLNLWNGFVRDAKKGMQNIQKTHDKWSKNFQKGWNRTWQNIGRFTNRTWQSLKKDSANGINNMHRSISNGLNAISGTWNNIWNGLKNFFGNIWDGIKKIAQDGMNAVISVINGGIGAIDAVWSFFTGHGSGIKKLGKVHFAQGGTVHRSLSVVNDGPGDDWKELMQFPDGSFGMAQERNWTGFLPVGTRIYSGPETKQIMNMAGIDHYATGGVVGAQHFAGGGIVRALEGWIAKIGDAVSGMDEKFRSMEDYLEAPVQRVKNVVQNAVGSNYGPLGHWGELAHGEWDKITDGMKHWVQHTITQFLYSFEGKSLSRDMMRSAATINKLKPSDGFFNMLWQVIMSESGGRNIVQQVHDVNSGGNEAAGILQYTPGTFAKYALPGHGERMNDFNQLLAFFNNTDWLGSIGSTIIRGVQKLDWLHSGPQGGTRNNFWPMLATGGEVFGTTRAIIGDNPEHHEFVINPYAPSAGPLLAKAYEATASAQGVATTGSSTEGPKLDKVIALLSQLADLVGDIDPQIILDMDRVTNGVNKKNAKLAARVKG